MNLWAALTVLHCINQLWASQPAEKTGCICDVYQEETVKMREKGYGRGDPTNSSALVVVEGHDSIGIGAVSTLLTGFNRVGDITKEEIGARHFFVLEGRISVCTFYSEDLNNLTALHASLKNIITARGGLNRVLSSRDAIEQKSTTTFDMPGENTDPKPNNVIRPVLGRKTSCINSKLTAEENCGATQRIRMFQKSYSERNHAASVSMEQSAIQVGQHVDPIKGSQNAREIKDTPPSLPSKRTLNPAPKLVRSGSIKNVASLFENGKNSENSNSPTKSIQPDLADLQVSGKVSRSKLDLEQIATNPSTAEPPKKPSFYAEPPPPLRLARLPSSKTVKSKQFSAGGKFYSKPKENVTNEVGRQERSTISALKYELKERGGNKSALSPLQKYTYDGDDPRTLIEEGIAKNGAMFQVFSNGLFNAKQTSSTIFDLTTPSVEFAKNNNKLLQDHHVPFKWSEDGTGIDMENWNSGLAEILNDWVKQEMMLPRWTGVPIKLNSDDGPNGAFGFSFTSGIFLPVGSEDLHEKLVMFFQLQYRKALLDATYAGASQLFLSQFNTPNEQVAKAAKDGLRVALRTFKGTKHPMTVYIPSQMQ